MTLSQKRKDGNVRVTWKQLMILIQKKKNKKWRNQPAYGYIEFDILVKWLVFGIQLHVFPLFIWNDKPNTNFHTRNPIWLFFTSFFSDSNPYIVVGGPLSLGSLSIVIIDWGCWLSIKHYKLIKEMVTLVVPSFFYIWWVFRVVPRLFNQVPAFSLQSKYQVIVPLTFSIYEGIN